MGFLTRLTYLYIGKSMLLYRSHIRFLKETPVVAGCPLFIFFVGVNKLYGSIPTVLMTLTMLDYFDFGNKNNSALSFVVYESNLMNFMAFSQHLFMPGFNELTGTIPTHVGQITNVQKLSLRTNNLVGTIPTEVGILTQLAFLDLGKLR